MTTDPGEGYSGAPSDERSVGELVFDVSERVSVLVREEIELAKAEVSEKVGKLLRGGAVAVVAGVFVVMGLAMFMHAIAWLLDDLFFSGNIWIGFAIEAAFWFAVAGLAGFIIDSYRHDPELMKVIIVEVTRAANSFGRTHLPEISRAYDSIAKIVGDGQERGEFRRDVDAGFASMWFYGAIEQLLSGWVFDLIPHTEDDFARARQMVVETICGGLEPRAG